MTLRTVYNTDDKMRCWQEFKAKLYELHSAIGYYRKSKYVEPELHKIRELCINLKGARAVAEGILLNDTPGIICRENYPLEIRRDLDAAQDCIRDIKTAAMEEINEKQKNEHNNLDMKCLFYDINIKFKKDRDERKWKSYNQNKCSKCWGGTRVDVPLAEIHGKYFKYKEQEQLDEERLMDMSMTVSFDKDGKVVKVLKYRDDLMEEEMAMKRCYPGKQFPCEIPYKLAKVEGNDYVVMRGPNGPEKVYDEKRYEELRQWARENKEKRPEGYKYY